MKLLQAHSNYQLIHCREPKEYEAGAQLFRSYAEYLGSDLSYQNFEEELKMMDQQYGPPSGALILVQSIDRAKFIGCVGVRQFRPEIAELKRMYLLPEGQGQGLGRVMLANAIQLAQELGYSKMQLDTFPSMQAAIKLYKEVGFYEIPPYRYNPNENTVFLEIEITP